MSLSGTSFLFGIILIATTAWVVMSWIRARHGYPPESGSREDGAGASRHVETLVAENQGLKDKVSRLEERLAVLERIATDPAERTAREIEKLR